MKHLLITLMTVAVLPLAQPVFAAGGFTWCDVRAPSADHLTISESKWIDHCARYVEGSNYVAVSEKSAKKYFEGRYVHSKRKVWNWSSASYRTRNLYAVQLKDKYPNETFHGVEYYDKDIDYGESNADQVFKTIVHGNFW